MSTLLRTALVRSALVVSGSIAGVGSAVALQATGARETITLAVGDTITPRHTVKTDSILEVVSTPTGQRIVARRCGSSFIYLRTWRGATQLSADTITANVPCAPPLPDSVKPTDTAKVAKVEVCFIPTDSAEKYHIDGSQGLDSATHALIQPWCKKADTLYLDPVTNQFQTRKA